MRPRESMLNHNLLLARRIVPNGRSSETVSLERSQHRQCTREMLRSILMNLMNLGSRAAEASASLALTHDLSTVSLPMISDQNTPDSEKFHFQAVSENEIKRIVMSFQSNKAPGYDKVPMAVIKDALPCILPPLTDIVNHSLSSVFPASWKISEVVPLPKDGDLELANNNRPCFLASSYVKDM